MRDAGSSDNEFVPFSSFKSSKTGYGDWEVDSPSSPGVLSRSPSKKLHIDRPSRIFNSTAQAKIRKYLQSFGRSSQHIEMEEGTGEVYRNRDTTLLVIVLNNEKLKNAIDKGYRYIHIAHIEVTITPHGKIGHIHECPSVRS